MIAQDTGSAIVGPARADIFWGAGDQAGQLAGRVHHPDKFAMLVPRELDPVAAGARMPLPPEKPPPPVEAKVRTPVLKPALKSLRRVRLNSGDPSMQNCRGGWPCEADEHQSPFVKATGTAQLQGPSVKLVLG